MAKWKYCVSWDNNSGEIELKDEDFNIAVQSTKALEELAKRQAGALTPRNPNIAIWKVQSTQDS